MAIGVENFELGIELLTAASNLYFAFRDRVSTAALLLLVIVLSPLLGIFNGLTAYASFALLED